jgi:exopolysaccharide production protein ExoQ
MAKKLGYLESAFIIFSILYYTGTLTFLGGGSSSAENPALQVRINEASPLLSFLQYVVFGGTLLLVVIWHQRILYLASKRPALGLFLLLALSSFLWSDVPDLALRRSIIFVGVSLLGLVIGARYTLKQQLYHLAIAMGLLIVINFLFTLAQPSIAIELGEHAGAWRGVYSQKNVASRIFVLSSLMLLLAAQSIYGYRYRYMIWGLLVLAVAMTFLTTSKSSLIILAILVILLPLCQILRLNKGLILPLTIILLLVVGTVVILLTANAEILVRFLGRDLTLTGRTGIWSVVISKIALRPWLGYGYSSFWLGKEGPAADIWYETSFIAPNAHNGFLDLLVDLGVVGLVLFLSSFIRNYMRAFTWLRLNPTAEGLLPILFLTFLLLFNLTETTMLESAPWVMIFYTALTTGLLTESISSDCDSPLTDYPFDNSENA